MAQKPSNVRVEIENRISNIVPKKLNDLIRRLGPSVTDVEEKCSFAPLQERNKWEPETLCQTKPFLGMSGTSLALNRS